MTDPNSLSFIYHHDAGSYVERAEKQLQLFDEGNPESLFYAAFELRMGIEARLYNGLKVLLQNLPEEEKKKHTQRIEKLSANKLFAKLKAIDENTLQPITLLLGKAGSQATSILQYTPVTKQLVKDRGEVSDLLHYEFFIKNKEWYHKEKILPNQGNMRSLMDYREILGDIAKRLDKATSGNLLVPPPFLLQLLDDVEQDTEESNN